MYKPERLLNRYFVFFWIVAFTLQVGQNFFNSIMAVFTDSYGYSKAFAGALSIPYLIGAVIGRMAGGWISDKKGRRAGIILGTSSFLVSSLLFMLPISHYAVVMIVLRFIHGFGYALGTTSCIVAAVDVTPKDKAAIGIGLNFTGMGTAFALAGFLVSACTAKGQSYNTVFLISSMIVAVSVLFGAFGRYEGSQEERVKTVVEEKKRSGFSGLINSSTLPYALIIFVDYTAQALTMFYLVTLAITKGMEDVSLTFTLCAVGMVVFSILLPRISMRFGPSLGMLPVCLGGFIGYLLYLYTNSLVVFVAAGLLYGASLSGIPIISDAALKTTPVYQRGSVTATIWLATDLAMGLTPTLWGALIDKFGYSVPFVTAAILFAVTYALTVTVEVFYKKRKIQQVN